MSNPFVGNGGVCSAEQIEANANHEIQDFTFGRALTSCILSRFGYNTEFASPKASIVNYLLFQGVSPSDARGQWGQ